MYYYFASTLPMISFDGNMPFTVDEFAGECQRLLTEKDYADARIALGIDESQAKNSTLAQWQEFDRMFKNEMVWVRAQQSQRNPANEVRGEREFDGRINQTVAQAAKTENLLDAQKMILRMQWEKLDELSLNKDFSLDMILTYGMKLKILERLNAFKTDDGHKKLEEIMANAGKKEQ